jgi:hypothetical protein
MINNKDNKLEKTSKDISSNDNGDNELNEEELEDVSGGTKTSPIQKSKPTTQNSHLFEIEDFSFDIEQILN